MVSDRVGYLKPSYGIFQHALALMDVAPTDAVHVGDSIMADVAGAHGAGIRAVLIERVTRGHGLPADDPDLADIPDVPRITDLWGLVDLLGLDRPAVAASRS